MEELQKEIEALKVENKRLNALINAMINVYAEESAPLGENGIRSEMPIKIVIDKIHKAADKLLRG